MIKSVAIVGAGVSGSTCAVVFAQRVYRTAIFADEIGQRTTSGAAAALWFPYDAEPADKVIAWALETYKVLVDLSRDVRTGVSMIELHQFSRTNEIPIPDWGHSLGASVIPTGVEESLTIFRSRFAMHVPLIDTTIYLAYLANRFIKAGGEINPNVQFKKLEAVDPKFDLTINCAGIAPRALADALALEH